MDYLTKRTRKGGLAVRVPMEVIQNRPNTVKNVLGMALDLPLVEAEGYRLYYGWKDPRTGGIIILAEPRDHDPLKRPPIMLECTWIRKYRTLVEVYEVPEGENG